HGPEVGQSAARIDGRRFESVGGVGFSRIAGADLAIDLAAAGGQHVEATVGVVVAHLLAGVDDGRTVRHPGDRPVVAVVVGQTDRRRVREGHVSARIGGLERRVMRAGHGEHEDRKDGPTSHGADIFQMLMGPGMVSKAMISPFELRISLMENGVPSATIAVPSGESAGRRNHMLSGAATGTGPPPGVTTWSRPPPSRTCTGPELPMSNSVWPSVTATILPPTKCTSRTIAGAPKSWATLTAPVESTCRWIRESAVSV